MQNIGSDWGQKGIHVPDRCPTRAIRWKLGSVHVGTAAAEVEAMIRERIAVMSRGKQGGEWTAEMIRHTVRYALWQHRENGLQYARVMGGQS
jgi:hypothetical protein